MNSRSTLYFMKSQSILYLLTVIWNRLNLVTLGLRRGPSELFKTSVRGRLSPPKRVLYLMISIMVRKTKKNKHAFAFAPWILTGKKLWHIWAYEVCHWVWRMQFWWMLFPSLKINSRSIFNSWKVREAIEQKSHVVITRR